MDTCFAVRALRGNQWITGSQRGSPHEFNPQGSQLVQSRKPVLEDDISKLGRKPSQTEPTRSADTALVCGKHA